MPPGAFLELVYCPGPPTRPAIGAGLGLNRPVNYAPKAKNVIYLYMSGGMSHLDTFDPKTSEVRGPMEQVKTKTDGLSWLRLFPYWLIIPTKLPLSVGLLRPKVHTSRAIISCIQVMIRGERSCTLVWVPGLQDWMAGSTLPYLVP